MIEIKKAVKRITPDTYRVLYNKPNKIVVILERESIGFREKGRRQVFRLPIEQVFKMAVRMEANRAAAEKRAKKKGGV